jgi:hypothetical protein
MQKAKQVSRFSGGRGMFGNTVNNQKFTPKTKVVLPTIRITQNKGGGGK